MSIILFVVKYVYIWVYMCSLGVRFLDNVKEDSRGYM